MTNIPKLEALYNDLEDVLCDVRCELYDAKDSRTDLKKLLEQASRDVARAGDLLIKIRNAR